MHLTSGYEKRKARIEIAPMFDLAFLLMVSFIYATMTMTNLKGVDIVLPAGDGQVQSPAGVIIAIAADNTITVDGGEPLDLDDAVAVASARARDRNAGVIVEGDRRADLEAAIGILSGLRNAGIEKVSFLVRKSGNEAQAK